MILACFFCFFYLGADLETDVADAIAQSVVVFGFGDVREGVGDRKGARPNTIVLEFREEAN